MNIASLYQLYLFCFYWPYQEYQGNLVKWKQTISGNIAWGDVFE